MKSKKLSVFLFGFVLFTGIALTGCVRPEILSQRLSSTIVKTDEGKDDYAYRYTVRVRNRGMAGKVRMIAELHTPDAQYYRDEIAHLDSDEEMDLEFTFTEVEFLDELFRQGKIQARFRYEVIR